VTRYGSIPYTVSNGPTKRLSTYIDTELPTPTTLSVSAERNLVAQQSVLRVSGEQNSFGIHTWLTQTVPALSFLVTL